MSKRCVDKFHLLPFPVIFLGQQMIVLSIFMRSFSDWVYKNKSCRPPLVILCQGLLIPCNSACQRTRFETCPWIVLFKYPARSHFPPPPSPLVTQGLPELRQPLLRVAHRVQPLRDSQACRRGRWLRPWRWRLRRRRLQWRRWRLRRRRRRRWRLHQETR